jgi:hypothetical protein
MLFPPDPASHLLAPPDPAFWKDVLFFERFDALMDETRSSSGLDAAWKRMGESAGVRRAAESIADRHGGGHSVRQQLVLAAKFCEHKRAAAVQTVARAVLPEPSGGHRARHPTALTLFEREPANLLAIDLWHRWHAQRLSQYRLKEPLAAPIPLGAVPWSTVITETLDELRPDPQTRRFEAHRVFHGPDDDVLLGFREWPKRRAIRTDSGPILCGRTPQWTLLRFHRWGDRLDVTDGTVERGARLGHALLRRLVCGAPSYELIEEPLRDRKLDDFLRLLTDPTDDVFPLVEITAEETWNPRRLNHTITGAGNGRIEESVESMRQLGAFALDWRTVRSAKVAFESKYRIQIHFPPAGEPTALCYSDVDRDKGVTARFAALLQRTLRVEVGPNTRRGSTPRRPPEAPPTRHGAAWWSHVLAGVHDRPADWLTDALAEVADLGLVTLTRFRVLKCGSPYLNRRAAGVDSLDCDGDVELPWEEADPDDPTGAEDEGCWTCSRGMHRWRPNRYKLPVDERVRVELVHDAIWRRLVNEAAHYAAAEEEPGRPGVLTLRLPTTRVALVYTPLASHDDLTPTAFGRTPTVWVHPACTPALDVGDRVAPLGMALADLGDLAAIWRVALHRAKKPYSANAWPLFALETGGTRTPLTRTLEITDEGVSLDGTRFATVTHMAGSLLALLRFAAAQDEADDSSRQPWTAESLIRIAAQRGLTVDRAQLQTWVSRTRAAIDEAFKHDPGLGKRVIVTHGKGYRLGDGFVCVDRRAASSKD